MNAPPERLGFMLADGAAAAVLSTGAHIAALPAGTAPVILLDAEAAAIAACAATPPDCVATAESLAYVMYTSGSTGRPKGVCVPHRAVVRLVNTDYPRSRGRAIRAGLVRCLDVRDLGRAAQRRMLALMAPRQRA
jgi:non-ribosomal peptide synthetase component F